MNATWNGVSRGVGEAVERIVKRAGGAAEIKILSDCKGRRVVGDNAMITAAYNEIVYLVYAPELH